MQKKRKKIKVIKVRNLPLDVTVAMTTFEAKEKYNRMGKKEDDRDKIDKGYQEWLDDYNANKKKVHIDEDWQKEIIEDNQDEIRY